MATCTKQADPGGPAPTRTDAPAAASVADLAVELGGRAVLREVNLEIPRACAAALLGPNGAGKSTLLRVLAGLLPPGKGTVRVFGQPMGAGAAKVKARVGLVAHQPMLYGDLTALENLEFFASLYAVPKPRRRAQEMLQRVAMQHRAGEAVKTLSRGMTQRVAIARALVHDPDLLLADEPFDGLDEPSAAALRELLAELVRDGKCVLFTDHDLSRSLTLAGRVILLRKGRVVLDRPAEELSVGEISLELSRP